MLCSIRVQVQKNNNKHKKEVPVSLLKEKFIEVQHFNPLFMPVPLQEMGSSPLFSLTTYISSLGKFYSAFKLQIKCHFSWKLPWSPLKYYSTHYLGWTQTELFYSVAKSCPSNWTAASRGWGNYVLCCLPAAGISCLPSYQWQWCPTQYQPTPCPVFWFHPLPVSDVMTSSASTPASLPASVHQFNYLLFKENFSLDSMSNSS